MVSAMIRLLVSASETIYLLTHLEGGGTRGERGLMGGTGDL